MTQLAETAGYLPGQFINQREGFWVARDSQQPVYLGCADEGDPTDASVRHFEEANPQAMGLGEGYTSMFGHTIGLVKIAAVAGEMKAPGFLAYAGGINALTEQYVEAAIRNVQQEKLWSTIPAAHSARPQEQAAFAAAGKSVPEAGQLLFCSHGDSLTGCAYCSAVGTASAVAGENADVQDIINRDHQYIFGNTDLAATAISAHAEVASQIGADYTIGRSRIVDLALPTMVLQRAGENDKHQQAARTGVLVNLDPRRVRNARSAREAGKDFYGLDLGAVALEIRRTLGQRYWNLFDPEHIVSAAIADAVPVRGVLVSHDTGPKPAFDPTQLALGKRPGIDIAQMGQIIKHIEHRNP